MDNFNHDLRSIDARAISIAEGACSWLDLLYIKYPNETPRIHDEGGRDLPWQVDVCTIR